MNPTTPYSVVCRHSYACRERGECMLFGCSLPPGWLEDELTHLRASAAYRQLLEQNANAAAVEGVISEFSNHPRSMAQEIVNLRKCVNGK